MDLGFQTPDYRAMDGPKSSGGKTPTKTEYPSLTIPDNIALAKSLRPGQEFTATIKVRVSEISIRERDDDDDDNREIGYPGSSGTRVELEVQEIDPQGVKIDEATSDEEDGSSAMKKFFNGKRKPTDGEEE